MIRETFKAEQKYLKKIPYLKKKFFSSRSNVQEAVFLNEILIMLGIKQGRQRATGASAILMFSSTETKENRCSNEIWTIGHF